MSREATLSIKEKWALDSQLGEMLRGLEVARHDPEKEFSDRLNKLMDEYCMNTDDTIEVLKIVGKKI